MFEEQYEFRKHLVQDLLLDTIGPAGGDHEVIQDPPATRYAIGILYPQSTDSVAGQEDQDEVDEGGEGVIADPAVAMANVRYPSSFGLTFAVDPTRAIEFEVRIQAAHYEPISADGAEPPTKRKRGSTVAGERWRRIPLALDPLPITVRDSHGDRRLVLAPGLELFVRVREPDADGLVAVTVVVLNTNRVGPTGGIRDADSFFQPVIEVATPSGQPAMFASRTGFTMVGGDEDLQSYQLLYRHAKAYAIGHGCAVEWDQAQDLSHATGIWTSFAPTYALRLADSNPDIESESLDLLFLASEPSSVVRGALGRFVDDYEAWLRGLNNELKTLPEPLRATAANHIDAVGDAIVRMRAGIGLLAEATVYQSFQLMNQAMLDMRSRSDWLKAGRVTPSPPTNTLTRWRPFQLAFVLLCLRGIVDDESNDRDLADLLWFPTGGGKTEAYLGLVAFTVFLRRKRFRETGVGVTVIMRYTLRLLTIQQFERASLLICCCEAIRKTRGDLGDELVSIGLWVGAGGTPNSLDEARKSLDKLRANKNLELEEGNPIQLHRCPWCGEPLDHTNYYISESYRSLVIACRRPQTECMFGKGLPVHVVDEDLYRAHPTLVIATADKFASLPWNEEVGHLFNLKSGNVRRPELIIQDELHLISGPLGTLAGLYETAIDFACTQDGRRPKVIASTATIRRASQQSRGLFQRDVRQFPPPGLDARDSYFAVEAPPDRRGTRLYLGLMAPGVSQATLLIRTYAALLQYAQDLPGINLAKDPYWTLVGYFNSLRVLAAARMQVQDDVGDRLKLLAESNGTEARPIEKRIELTSREPSGAIPSHLARMALDYPNQEVLDVILATNMISVGVDIDRLGLMVVMGQPQATSEYIQATSRVGRQWPGLVIVLLNAARSRDRSHYESFTAYHSALYRQVEATSVTPFSSRARDRALHAVVIALARMIVRGYRSNDSARRILTHRNDLDAVKTVILKRVSMVSPDDVKATGDEVDRIFEDWAERARQVPDLVYSSPRNPSKALLSEAATGAEDDDGSFPTARSLRDVDQASNLYLVWS